MRWLVALLVALPASAETVVATRVLRPNTVIQPGDVVAVASVIEGALRDPAEAIGQEARVAIYAGRPIRIGDIGPPALVERNQLVTLAYQSGLLMIRVEGRALSRGARGEIVRVMNLASRAVVSGRVEAPGLVAVVPQS
jgi:flagella basal body P-ring formation protein FlgA